MATGRLSTDLTLLEAALIGFEHMQRNFEEKIAEIRRRLGGDGATGAAVAQTGKRTLSAAARRRIAAAQRKRWAAVKAESKPKPLTVKRTMSAAARKRIAAAQRKRWALAKANKAGKASSRKSEKKTARTAA
jgi:hypothetical protein